MKTKRFKIFLLAVVFLWGWMVSTRPEGVYGAAYDSAHDLSNFAYRTVNTGGRGNLVFQQEPGGSFMTNYTYQSGDQIYVNLTWRENGYTIAYQDGVYGFVDASYISWTVGSAAPAAANTTYDPHTLTDFGYRTVSTAGRGSLIFQSEPGGAFLNDYKYQDGQSIYVNLTWREKGYTLAYQDGVYGYVDASYINWGSASTTGYDPHTLADFGYRTVSTAGRGSLIFQKAPAGAFMNEYTYQDGDTIYVNLSWRENGYALAYQGGVYGYVDASYINWNTSPVRTSYDPYALSDFGYRTVNTAGRGSLIFQTEPGGAFLNDYTFWDGDSIYVNLYYFYKGYALAYKNGVYGYVDSSYISW